MLKIHQNFILKFLLLFVSTLAIVSLIGYVALKSIIIEHNKTHLKNVIKTMELRIDEIENLDDFVSKIHKKTALRVTIIDTNGAVLAESHHNKKEMDNHSSRFEILESNRKEFGFITRYSSTVKTDFLYIAKKVIYKNSTIYIRLSMSLEQILRDFYSIWVKLFFIFLGVALVATYVSKKMSHKIVYDIEQIQKYLDEVSYKNYKAPVKVEYFYEFLQISILLKNLVKKLNKNERKKQKSIAKLRLINKQRNDILSALSHEIKNPVASIIGYTQTIQEDPNMPQPIKDKFLAKIGSNGEKISKMLDRLILSVKLENGDLSMKNSYFNIKTVCEDVVLNLSLKYKNRTIVLDISDDERVFADKTMVELILINLIDNALKYSNDDIFVDYKNRKISVKDSGIGIKEEHINKVTDKFYRVEKNSWDNSMGLGLAMVKQILRSMGSALEIESKPKQGSTFSFVLPNQTSCSIQ